ncbi:6237_t:CDS:2 [Paraglomus brasilianum]|uniref:threonine synthase n=1 Tax=Paraglomus brasilianum TaxID=144538 RepID=A0A9N9B1E5_9GLOM|nr:6237_t:CDS:2 [Paraglomus brasilianum]
MKYRSTRGFPTSISFSEAVQLGLSPDGGLFIPNSIPTLPFNWPSTFFDLSFNSLALEIFSLYVPESEIPRSDLEVLIDRSYSTFRHPSVAPLTKIKDNLYVLELFHGPTFAFKDVALQFLGNLFEYLLEKKNKKEGKEERITVLGATSGDTGSAAIYGLKGKKNISVFILHPFGRVSPIQEAQMTTVLDSNIHNLAVKGTFDDCQDTVKALFGDTEFNSKYHLGAVNSINWARILAQITYYFHSYFQLLRSLNLSPEAQIKIQYCVPTGNFGDILAGYYAKRMGLPISSLLLATNSNDILHRFFSTGQYEKVLVGSDANANTYVYETLSPAMDIVVSSNFERLLWYLAYEKTGKEDEASITVKNWMQDVKDNKGLTVDEEILNMASRDFTSCCTNDDETLDVISRYYSPESSDQVSHIFDPHTAVGIAAAEKKQNEGVIQICLATAHPAKFSKAVETALKNAPHFNFDEILPPEFVGLLEKKRRVVRVEGADPGLVKEVIEREIRTEMS